MRSWPGWSWADGNFGGSGLQPLFGTFEFHDEEFILDMEALLAGALTEPIGGRLRKRVRMTSSPNFDFSGNGQI